MKILIGAFIILTLLIGLAHAADAVRYTCPMHPQIISDIPGQCPICGMELVAISPKHVHSPQAEKSDGKPALALSSEAIQKMGVRTEKAAKTALGGGLRTTGIIIANERARHDIYSQLEGRVETLAISAEGDLVRKGDVFYTLYSPELLALQNDYLASRKAGYNDLAASARKRMKLLGVDDRVLEMLAKNGKTLENVPFYAPANGIVNRLSIRKGQYLMANSEIAQIQDLSSIWVEAAISEKDMSVIKEGDQARIMLGGSSSEREATIDYIYPAITPETRTGKARLVVDNADYLLKPGGYVTIILAVHTREMLTVPSSALLRDSTGAHVIVALGNGRFQTREVEAGKTWKGRTEIMEGLTEGEEIVINGQFLIDSESSLRESLQNMSGEHVHE